MQKHAIANVEINSEPLKYKPGCVYSEYWATVNTQIYGKYPIIFIRLHGSAWRNGVKPGNLPARDRAWGSQGSASVGIKLKKRLDVSHHCFHSSNLWRYLFVQRAHTGGVSIGLNQSGSLDRLYSFLVSWLFKPFRL